MKPQAVQARIASKPAPSQPPAPPLIGGTGSAKLDAIADVVNTTAAPFQNAPDPARGTLGKVEHAIGAVMGVVGAPFQLLDTGFALATAPLAAMMPAFPAATLMMPHLGMPHGHLHPPSLIPPSPVPIPLPSIGTVMLAGSVSVLIGGLPAARASDVGLAPLCFSFAPAFDIFTGSSNTWIGGSRAARQLDITRHCNPASAMGAIGKAMGAIGVVAGAVSAGASASAGETLKATMQAAQAAADAGALAMSALLGKDPGVPPSMGAIMMGNPTVLIGGFPMPDVLELLGGLMKGLKMLGKAVGKSKAFGKLLNKVGLCNAPGEPVHPFTGEVYNDFEDYRAPDSALCWERHYRSGWSHEDGPFGYGYRHVFQRTLTLLRRRALYATHDGEVMALEKREDGSYVPRDGFALSVDGPGLRLQTDRGETLHFVADEGVAPRLVRYVAGPLDVALAYDQGGRLVAFAESLEDGVVETRLLYDEAGHVIELRRGLRGQPAVTVSRYEYDGGCIVAWRDALGASKRFRYDAAHRMVQATDRRGYSFHWAYDAASGRCIKSQGDDGLWGIEAKYHGSWSTFTEADGGVWTYKHFPDGVLSHLIGPDGGVKQYVRDDSGRIVKQVMPGGDEYTWLYDATGKHYGRLDCLGHLVPPEDEEPNPNPLAHDGPVTAKDYLLGRPLARLSHGFMGLPSKVRGALEVAQARAAPLAGAAGAAGGAGGAGATPQRDALGRPVLQVERDGSLRHLRYDAEGNLTGECWAPPWGGHGLEGPPTSVDRRGWRTREYASWNLLAAETSPLGHTTRYEYSHREKWKAIVDANGNRTDYVRDARHRIKEIHRFGGLFRRYVYDAFDAVVEEQDGHGQALVKHKTGPHGLHVASALASGEKYTYEYDASGQFTDASSSQHHVAQRHVGAKLALDERDGKGVVHRYGPGLRLVGTTFFGRFDVTYEYPDASSVRITTPDGAIHTISRNEGEVVRHNGNKTCEALAFDAEGRLVARASWWADEPEYGPLRTTSYRYSAAGELLSSVDSDGCTRSYRYDADNRLVAEADQRGERCYAYDAAGNLTRTARFHLVEYAEGNLAAFADFLRLTNDARGRRASQERPGGHSTTYHYDSFDQLVEVRFSERPEVWRAAYDGLGRRLWRQVGDERTDFYWDGDRLAAERFPDGKVRLYVYPNEDALVPFMWLDYRNESAAPETGEAHYLFAAPNGMPVRVEDAFGRAVWEDAGAEAYGELDETKACCPTRLRFAGHFHDETLGLFYNRFRDYDPALGRYVQPDPLGHAGGINLFAYSSNPLAEVDLRGLAHKKARTSAAGGGQNDKKRSVEKTADDGDGITRTERRAERGKRLSDGSPLPPGTKKVTYSDGQHETHYYVTPQGRTVRAEIPVSPPAQYQKKGVGHIRPEGYQSGRDHRGHLGSERGAVNQKLVNQPENVIAEHGRKSNLSEKKAWENSTNAYASEHPDSEFTSVHEPHYSGDDPRPTEVKHMLIEDGVENTDFRQTIPNPTS